VEFGRFLLALLFEVITRGFLSLLNYGEQILDNVFCGLHVEIDISSSFCENFQQKAPI
jgi:hypothetical protein